MTTLFSFWRFVIQIGRAKSLVWQITDQRGFRHLMAISLATVLHPNGLTAYQFFLGPVFIMVGYIGKPKL